MYYICVCMNAYMCICIFLAVMHRLLSSIDSTEQRHFLDNRKRTSAHAHHGEGRRGREGVWESKKIYYNYVIVFFITEWKHRLQSVWVDNEEVFLQSLLLPWISVLAWDLFLLHSWNRLRPCIWRNHFASKPKFIPTPAVDRPCLFLTTANRGLYFATSAR